MEEIHNRLIGIADYLSRNFLYCDGEVKWLFEQGFVSGRLEYMDWPDVKSIAIRDWWITDAGRNFLNLLEL